MNQNTELIVSPTKIREIKLLNKFSYQSHKEDFDRPKNISEVHSQEGIFFVVKQIRSEFKNSFSKIVEK
jgi:hypothetical protein